MTLIIGIRCEDGLVIGADSMATEAAPLGGPPMTRFETEKIVIQRDLLWGFSGDFGVGQRVKRELDARYSKVYQRSFPPVILREKLVECIGPIVRAQNQVVAACYPPGSKFQLPWANFLFGAYLDCGFCLINIEGDMRGEVVEATHFATGSGAKTGQALLRRLRNQTWDLPTGEVIAYRTMTDAIHVEPSGIGPPIRLARYTLRDGKGIPEMIEGADHDCIRDTAQVWTEAEQGALDKLNAGAGGDEEQSDPIPHPSQ